MSLDVYLMLEDTYVLHTEPRIFIRDGGQNKEISREEWDTLYPGREPVTLSAGVESGTVYHANITHNLNVMAGKADLYNALWRPDENGFETAEQLIQTLMYGLNALKSDREYYEQFNPTNGWGTYDGLIQFVEDYLAACRQFPKARVEVDR